MASFEEQFDSLGFIPGVVRGARTFAVNSEGDLTGLFFRQIWRLGVNNATCMKIAQRASYPPIPIPYYQSTPVDVPPPAEPLPPHLMDSCRHGFYAYVDGSNDYRTNLSVGVGVEGIVEGWGEVMIGTRGFRAMKARIVALCVPTVRLVMRDRYELMRTKYATVPMFHTFEDMVSEYPPDIGENL